MLKNNKPKQTPFAKLVQITIGLSLLILFYIWGYVTHSRHYFPFSLISNEYKSNLTKTTRTDRILRRFNPYSLIRIDDNNQDSIRRFITHAVLGQDSLPALLPVESKEIRDDRYQLGNLEKINEIKIAVGEDFFSYVHHFIPRKKIKGSIIYHQGHEGDFIAGKSTIAYFVEKGFSVYALAMPLTYKNHFTVNNQDSLNRNYPTQDHRWLQFRPNPLSYFIQPVTVIVNYQKTIAPDDPVYMLGISGGGWTTHMTAAIDERIQMSFGVAGSYPMFISINDPSAYSGGDFEQHYMPLFRHIDYLDLYVLACSGKRKHHQILNLNDPCCFKRGLGYLYHPDVNKKNKELNYGEFGLFVDSSNNQHTISAKSLEYIYNNITSQ